MATNMLDMREAIVDLYHKSDREARQVDLGFRIGNVAWLPQHGASITIYINPHYIYNIDYDRIATPAQLVDWITHLSHKAWFTDEVMVSLVRVWQQVARVKGVIKSKPSLSAK